MLERCKSNFFGNNSNQFNQPKYFFDVSKYLVIFLKKKFIAN